MLRLLLLVIFAHISFTVLGANNATLTFIVVGDWGRNGLKNQSEVATSMGKWCQQYGPCDFVISTGDNMYQYGVKDEHAAQFATSFENVYVHPGLEGLRFYLALGNHDYRSNPEAQILYTKHSKRWYMPSNYFTETFEVQSAYANGKQFNILKTTSSGTLREDIEREVALRLKMVVIDTNPLIQYYHNNTKMNQTAITSFDKQKQMQFYEKEMEDTQDEWRIVVGHHPMYSAGNHGNNVEIIKSFESKFLDDQVAVYFAGHDHSLQRLINPTFGTNQVVSGAGSSVKYDVKPHKFLKESQQDSGFCFVRLTSSQMQLQFVNLRGEETSKIVVGKL